MSFRDRPLIVLKIEKTDRLLFLASALIVIIIWVIAFRAYTMFPETIPTRFDANGKVQTWGSRKSLFMLPSVCTGMTLLLAWLSRFPQFFNYPTTITKDNAAFYYQLASRAIRWLCVTIPFVFGLELWQSIRSVKNNFVETAGWLWVAEPLLVLTPVVIAIFKMVNKQKK
ncbi:MAG: DUF1648 domain-containing protein [Bacteroidetes bacterium]|nr:DUF1648 domain-containing protein [Bacteroidota bacterium]